MRSPPARHLHWNWEEGQADILYNRIRDAASTAAAFPLPIRGEGGRGVGVVSPVSAGKYI